MNPWTAAWREIVGAEREMASFVSQGGDFRI
jgi:hypothetical protein